MVSTKPFFSLLLSLSLPLCLSFFFFALILTLAKPRNTNLKGRLSTVDLLIKLACLVKKVKNVCNIIKS